MTERGSEPDDAPIPEEHPSDAPAGGTPPAGGPAFAPPAFGPPPSPGYGPPPFAYGVWKEPWIVPRRKGAVVLIACVAAVVLLGIGMLSGAALRGGGGDHRPGPRYERNGAGQFPGAPGQFPMRPGPRHFPHPMLPAGSGGPNSPTTPAPSSS